MTPELALRAAEMIAQKFEGRHAVILFLPLYRSSPSERRDRWECFDATRDGRVNQALQSADRMQQRDFDCRKHLHGAKPLPTIQMLTNRSAIFGSLAYDYRYFELPNSHVIEMFDAGVERLLDCFHSFLRHGLEENPRQPITKSFRFPSPTI